MNVAKARASTASTGKWSRRKRKSQHSQERVAQADLADNEGFWLSVTSLKESVGFIPDLIQRGCNFVKRNFSASFTKL